MASVRPEAWDPPPSYYGAFSSSEDQFDFNRQTDLRYPDTNFYNAATSNRYAVQPDKTTEHATTNTNGKLNCCISFIDSKLKLVVFIIILVFVTLVLIAGIVIFLLFAISPCTLTKCHSKASTCKNHFLRAQCVCDYGYGGDGINYCDECGVVNTQANLRIVGGVSAVAYSWPATALLIFSYKARVFISSTNEYVIISQQSTCGGTLIDRETVLSAAHCIPTELDFKYNNIYYTVDVKPNSYYPTYESMMTVYLGVYDKTQLDVSPAQKFSARKLVRHSDYNPNTNLNDIALVLLSSQATLSKYTQIACLPDYKIANYPTQTNIPGYIVGWGDLYGNRTYSNILQNAQVTVYNSSACGAVFPSVKKNWNSQICAGNLTGGVDSCQGDSGGSMYVKGAVNDQTKYISTGVVSYGNGCALAGYPGVYTRVSYYIDWILYEKWA